MSFMTPDIQETEWFEVETNEGTEIVPADLVARRGGKSRFADYVRGSEIYSSKIRKGFLARLSASGYMDCTDWAGFKTGREAALDLIDTYGEEGEGWADWVAELCEEWMIDLDADAEA